MSEIIKEENSADEPPLSFENAAKWLARIDPAKCRWQEIFEELVQAYWRGELKREDGSTGVFTNDTNVTKSIGYWICDPLKGPYRKLQEYFDAVRDDSFKRTKMEPIKSAPPHYRTSWEPANLYCWMDLEDNILDEYNSCDALAERPLSGYSEDDLFFIKKLRIERSVVWRWWERSLTFVKVPTCSAEPEGGCATESIFDVLYWTYDETITWIQYRDARMVEWALGSSGKRSGENFLSPSHCPYKEFVEERLDADANTTVHFKSVCETAESELRSALRRNGLTAHDAGTGDAISPAVWSTHTPDGSNVFERDRVLQLWPEIGKEPRRLRGRPKGEQIDDAEAVQIAKNHMSNGKNKTKAVSLAVEEVGVRGHSESADLRRISRKLGKLAPGDDA